MRVALEPKLKSGEPLEPAKVAEPHNATGPRVPGPSTSGMEPAAPPKNQPTAPQGVEVVLGSVKVNGDNSEDNPVTIAGIPPNSEVSISYSSGYFQSWASSDPKPSWGAYAADCIYVREGHSTTARKPFPVHGELRGYYKDLDKLTEALRALPAFTFLREGSEPLVLYVGFEPGATAHTRTNRGGSVVVSIKWRPAGTRVLESAAPLGIQSTPPKTIEKGKPPQAEISRAVQISFDLGNGVKLEMVLIPAGEFMMGSPDWDNNAGAQERPQHRVRITKPFYMGKYLVTQEQWEAVMGNNPSRFKGPKNPVEQVSLGRLPGVP